MSWCLLTIAVLCYGAPIESPAASIPPGLDVTILVVDNNSQDDTEQVVREIQSDTDLKLVYVKETNRDLRMLEMRESAVEPGI